jgi:hypothetical protein
MTVRWMAAPSWYGPPTHLTKNSPRDICSGVELGTEVRCWEGSSQRWVVKFLHTGNSLEAVLPELAAKMAALVRRVDAEHWQLCSATPASASAPLAVRCCEYHRMAAGGHLAQVSESEAGGPSSPHPQLDLAMSQCCGRVCSSSSSGVCRSERGLTAVAVAAVCAAHSP